MQQGIDWDRVAKADWIDKKARMNWIAREYPDASPYFNLMAECVKPTDEDYASAKEFVEQFGYPAPASSPSRFVHPFNSILNGILSL